MRWRFIFGAAVGLVVGWSSGAAWGLQVGINVDIHQDVNVPGLPDGFMIWGHVRSGLPLGIAGGGGWNSPPTLADHVDGYAPNVFANFDVQIQADDTDPLQNRFTITAQWSGPPWAGGIPYCTTWHLGLFLNVECHNVIIDVRGTWLRGGLPIGIGANQGFVPLSGFDVQDQSTEQYLRLQNGNGDGTMDLGEIEMAVVQMDVAAVADQEELEGLLGSQPLHELYLEGLQQGLDWVPVLKDGLPISPSNPVYFQVDSFFDVFLDVPMATGLHPQRPVPIPPGGFLVARQKVQFINNNYLIDYRWFWEFHEAHQADLGDAPDSTNTWGAAMTAYPPGVAGGVAAHFPTVYLAGSPPFGPIHFRPRAAAWLGPRVTLEDEADIGPDQDGLNNLDPPGNLPDRDGADDGVLFPLVLSYCVPSTFQYQVFVPWPNPPNLFVNVWFDWNRDGDWDDTLDCGVATAPEWAVQNQQLAGLPVGLNVLTTPPIHSWYPPGSVTPAPIWMRITLAERQWVPGTGQGSGGAGPARGYRYGETEDYYFELELEGACCWGEDAIQCTATTAELCRDDLQGVWMGTGTTCDDLDGDDVADVCQGQVGACCYGDFAPPNLCTITNEAGCELLLGQFMGVGTDCQDLDGDSVADICEPPPRDTVVCEPQGGNNPAHPSTYWYDVTPRGNLGRCDFHVRVYDPDALHYTNVVAPANWKFAVHQVSGEWWASWWDPECDDAIYGTFRFSFDNPRPSMWGDWTTTIAGSSDPYEQVVDQSGNHTGELDGNGYRVHVPRALRDLVVCEPQGDGNPLHPSTYWYDVTPDTLGRCDFHVRVFDPDAANYTNAVMPTGWQFAVHQVAGQWWASWWDPNCSNAIFGTFRFQFDNPNPNAWSHWVTTIGNVSDPFTQMVDRSQAHAEEPDGGGFRVHVPTRPALHSKWLQPPHAALQGFDGMSDLWLHDETNLPYKWTQGPDPQLPGLHAHDGYQVGDPSVYQRVLLADDWLCSGLPVVRVSWYGNYETDAAGAELRGSGIAQFRLSIHLCQAMLPWCVPSDPPQWQAQVPLAQVGETDTGLVNSEGCRIYHYSFTLPAPFDQVAGTYYWLDVGAISNDANNPALWRWQEARRGPAPPLGHAPAAQKTGDQNWSSIIWPASTGTAERYSDLAFEISPAEFEVNKVLADDFVSDGRPITALRWWGSYFDERYMPDYPQPDARHVLDGWLVSFHHDPVDSAAVSNCPPDGNQGEGTTVLGLYFAPVGAVTIEGLDMVDCHGHTLYEYQVHLSDCCLVCAVEDPRLPGEHSPAWPGRFAEVSGLAYWLDIQAVTGGEWLPATDCVFRYTGHVPSEIPDNNGHFWGWHTSSAEVMPSALESACVGRLNLPLQPGPSTSWCPEYVDWTKQIWACPYIPPAPAPHMAFELLTPWLPSVEACCMRGGICREVPPLDCVFVWQGQPQGSGSTCTPNTCPPCRGDGNCDLAINWRDIDYLIAGMNDNESAWRALFPPPGPLCPFLNLDCNDDEHVNWRDIDPFIRLMNTMCPS